MLKHFWRDWILGLALLITFNLALYSYATAADVPQAYCIGIDIGGTWYELCWPW